ncbi:MAG: PAS domain S-box protein [Phycisphaera sp. RhM]|nr:PAS domain S-box protein [Phycisphaera sp. RhM]
MERRTEELSEALDRFKSIAEHLPDCIWQRVMREDGTSYVSYVSPGWEKIWGYSVDEIYRDADLWLKSVMPEDHSHAANLKPRAAITKTSQSSVFRIRSKQGDLRWVEDIAIPIFDERNRLVRYEGVARDITHRQSSRDELILRSQALASAKHGLVIVDAIQEDMPITYCNAAFEQMTGYTEEEVLGRNCRFLQGNDHEQPGLRRLRSAIRSGQSCSVTLRNYRNSGELFWNRLSIAPVKNERGELTHFVGAQEDVSHQVQLTKAKNQLADFHSLVLEISTQFISCGETEFKLILRRGLEAIGQLLAATRCFFVELSPDQSVLREAYEWCTEGSLPQFESLSGAATTDVPWISNQLMAACDPGGDQDPPTSDDDRTSFFEYGADSILCIPIQVDQSVRGILGVAEITNQQILDLDLYPLLTIVGDLFITARHRILAEENLSRHWALLEESQRIAHLGNWEWAPHNNQFVCSNELCRIFGHAPEEKPASVEIFLQCSNDDERLDLFASFDRVMATGEPIAIEHEIRDSTGRDRVLLTRCFRVTFKNGSPDVVRGTCQDITELRTEETKFRGLLDAAPDAMVIVDSRGTIQIANCQAEWMFGYSREELIGNPVEMLVPGQLRDVHRDHRAEFVNTPAVRPMGQEMELRGVRKDGSDLAVEISLSPFKTPSGVLTTAAVRDITARKEAERELQRSRERLDEAQKIAHIGYWDWDVQAGKTWWSDELYTICGVIKDSFQPTFPAFLDLVVEGDRPKLTAAWHDLLSGGEPFQLSYQLNTASGTRFHTFYAHSISDSSGTLLHLTGIVQDSTEQRIIENQLRLRERLVSVGTLAAGIAHEINNPLSAIMTAAVTARVVQSATQPNELVNECVDTITSAVVRTQKIVQNVLRLSRQESSEKEQANLNHIVTQASSLTKHFSDTHGANVLVDLEDDIPDLHLNTSEIEQVIVNLITNAVKSGDPAAVMIRTEKQGDRVKVIVSDNGCGIPESRLDRIFDPFYTSESALKGTGLGLTISHRIICDHGGEITVESVEGQGSTFTVELPVSDEKDA